MSRTRRKRTSASDNTDPIKRDSRRAQQRARLTPGAQTSTLAERLRALYEAEAQERQTRLKMRARRLELIRELAERRKR